MVSKAGMGFTMLLLLLRRGMYKIAFIFPCRLGVSRKELASLSFPPHDVVSLVVDDV